ncbi:hypothetical protein ACIQYF_01555 [Pseudomonas sp. NPDC096917]|uniref:hypothetical protein n=1 Tax=Pseudomonas sp. NPDC096917 TaxID=3364483 RepID=UPI00383AA109
MTLHDLPRLAIKVTGAAPRFAQRTQQGAGEVVFSYGRNLDLALLKNDDWLPMEIPVTVAPRLGLSLAHTRQRLRKPGQLRFENTAGGAVQADPDDHLD